MQRVSTKNKTAAAQATKIAGASERYSEFEFFNCYTVNYTYKFGEMLCEHVCTMYINTVTYVEMIPRLRAPGFSPLWCKLIQKALRYQGIIFIYFPIKNYIVS